MRKIVSKNPFTAQINKEFDFISNEDLNKKIERAYQAYSLHKNRRIQERAEMIKELGQNILKKRKHISELITTEIGKPIKQAEGQVDKTVNFCKHYSKHFHDFLATPVKSDAKVKTLIKYLPMGPIYFIIPFNFPFFLNFKSGLPNLLLGNVMLVRNSDMNPLLGETIEDLMNESGFDSGEYQNVFTSHDQLDQILSSDKVIGVSFTGSTKTGSSIAEKAGKYLKKSVMELGGNDPFVVLHDANIDQAAEDAFKSRCANAGQVCFSPKRFIIVKQHFQKFKEKLVEKVKTIKYGNPLDPASEMGPLARENSHELIRDQFKRIPKSWKIIFSREGIEKPFFPITIIEGTEEQFDEQIFGPVFTLFKAENEQHAIKLANMGTFGLSASVYSKARGEQVVEQIRAGMGFVNSPAKSDYMFPTGGVGQSGYGREGGVEGNRNFTNVRVQYVN